MVYEWLFKDFEWLMAFVMANGFWIVRLMVNCSGLWFTHGEKWLERIVDE